MTERIEEIQKHIIATQKIIDTAKEELRKVMLQRIVKEHECCPDVCNIINTLIKSTEEERYNIDKKVYELEQTISKIGIPTTKAEFLIKEETKRTKERLKSLNELKSHLKKLGVCDCY